MVSPSIIIKKSSIKDLIKDLEKLKSNLDSSQYLRREHDIFNLIKEVKLPEIPKDSDWNEFYQSSTYKGTIIGWIAEVFIKQGYDLNKLKKIKRKELKRDPALIRNEKDHKHLLKHLKPLEKSEFSSRLVFQLLSISQITPYVITMDSLTDLISGNIDEARSKLLLFMAQNAWENKPVRDIVSNLYHSPGDFNFYWDGLLELLSLEYTGIYLDGKIIETLLMKEAQHLIRVSDSDSEFTFHLQLKPSNKPDVLWPGIRQCFLSETHMLMQFDLSTLRAENTIWPEQLSEFADEDWYKEAQAELNRLFRLNS